MFAEDAGHRREASTQGVVSRPRRPIKSTPRVAALALALLLLAGGQPGWTGRGVALAQEAARPRGRTDPALLDPAAVWSRLVVLRAEDGKSQDARPVVVLKRPAGWAGVPDMRQPIRLDMLPREMVRQATLIAARDELGLATRDEVIDETRAGVNEREAQGANAAFAVGSLIRDNRSREIICRIDDRRTEVILSHETPIAPGRNLELTTLLAAAETLSRQTFPGFLKSMGLVGKPNAIKPEAELPVRVENRLASVGFLDVLLAVRELHQAIRTDGESPARLGALARGYALLGVLSEHEWHPAHRAYKARALLYAQRLIARDPDAPWGLWHRAFALALAGRHGDALSDLQAARAKAGPAGKGAPAPPDWLDLIDAYCRFDSARLARAKGPQTKLAALLRMFTLAFPRSTAAGLRAARDIVLLQPYCFRAHDIMSSYHGVSTLHQTTLIGPQGLEHFITVKLPTVDELPQSVKDHLGDQPGILPTAERLDKAGAPGTDAGEPSWAVLGHMLRETRFVQVFRRLHFMKVPVDAYWNEVHLDVAGHRYRPYLETLALAPHDTAESFPLFAGKLDLTEIETTESPMNTAVWFLPSERAKAPWNIAKAHQDGTAEIAISLADAQDQDKLPIARDLLQASPYHPYARNVLIARDWEHVKDQVATWRKEAGDSPALLAALGTHYSATKEYDDAQRALARYIELSPDLWAYRLLAANFKDQSNTQRWQETLDAFLNTVEDLGLDHAQVRVEIADYYMGLKDWDKARPYAEAAAQTWAEWAMNCAARCAEGEKNWERAEAWYSRVTERYANNSWAVWYFFCKRTEKGNLDAARASVEQHIALPVNQADLQAQQYFGCFYWLDGRIDKAKAVFAEAYQKQTSIAAALALAQIADDEKDAARRDALLGELITKHRDKAPKTIAISQIFLETILAPEGKARPFDVAAVEPIVASIPEESRGNTEFFVGWLLKNHNQPQEARQYLQRCGDSPKTMIWYRYLANDALKRMGAK
jgi:tetratricopeptide (TPR) repeat protein